MTYTLSPRGTTLYTPEVSDALLEADVPPEVILREAFRTHREEILAGDPVLFDIPGIGKLEFRERQYRFHLNTAYAKRQHRPATFTGRWGTTDDRSYDEGIWND